MGVTGTRLDLRSTQEVSVTPHTHFVLPLVPATGRVRFSKLSTPVLSHTVQRGHGGRYRLHPVGRPPGPGAWVFPVGAEGVAPLVCAHYKFCDPMLLEVVASPLRVLLNRCRG